MLIAIRDAVEQLLRQVLLGAGIALLPHMLSRDSFCSTYWWLRGPAILKEFGFYVPSGDWHFLHCWKSKRGCNSYRLALP